MTVIKFRKISSNLAAAVNVAVSVSPNSIAFFRRSNEALKSNVPSSIEQHFRQIKLKLWILKPTDKLQLAPCRKIQVATLGGKLHCW